MKGITSIGHVAIRVKEFERSLAFYVGKLGFSEMFRLDRDGSLWIIYLRVIEPSDRRNDREIGDRHRIDGVARKRNATAEILVFNGNRGSPHWSGCLVPWD